MANKHRDKRHNNDNKSIRDINVVPYIDVMLVLLVIFMATAPLMYQQIDINLPQTTTSSEAELKEHFIVVDLIKSDKLTVNYSGEQSNQMDELPVDDLVKHKQQHQLNKIFIRSDEAIQYGKVISIMETLKNNNMNNIGLITEKGQ